MAIASTSAVATLATKTPTSVARAVATLTTSHVITRAAAIGTQAGLATGAIAFAPPEVYTARFVTSLTADITSGLRPTVISVAATQAAFGAGTFSIAIYDAGTDANPVNFEALEVLGGGASLNWFVTTEQGWSSLTHAAGSTVVATVLTPRSITQPLNNHANPLNSPDPHSIYLRKTSYTKPGDLVVGTGATTQFMTLPIGTDGQALTADSTRPGGMRWLTQGIGGALQHMGDLIVGGLLGALSRLGIGAAGQTLTVVNNPAVIGDPGIAPTCTPTGSGGSLIDGFLYDFAYSWETSNPSPDGGETRISPIATVTATSTGVIAVQCPPSPAAGAMLHVYGQVHATLTMVRVGTLVNASVAGSNIVQIGSLPDGVVISPSTINTTGGLTAGWAFGPGGTLRSLSLVLPPELVVYGSPATAPVSTIGSYWTAQQPNMLFAGPVPQYPSPYATTPAFRRLDMSDMPSGVTAGLSVTLTATARMTVTAAVTGTIEVVIGGGGVALTTGIKGDIRIDPKVQITGWYIYADQSGSVQFDIWLAQAQANFPPTVSNTIIGGGGTKPILSASVASAWSNLNNWTTSLPGGCILRINIDSVSTITRATLALQVVRYP